VKQKPNNAKLDRGCVSRISAQRKYNSRLSTEVKTMQAVAILTVEKSIRSCIPNANSVNHSNVVLINFAIVISATPQHK
jgi:hypothetical protein